MDDLPVFFCREVVFLSKRTLFLLPESVKCGLKQLSRDLLKTCPA